MAEVGRPRSYTDEQIEEIKGKFLEYINSENIPIIAEFAYKNEIPRNTLYDYPEFSTLVRRCIDKKESQLEKLGLDGDVNTSMAIFSLKQLGWRDKQDLNMSTDKPLSIAIEVVETDEDK